MNATFSVLLDELLRDVGTVLTAEEWIATLPELDPKDRKFLAGAAMMKEAVDGNNQED